MVTNDNGNKKLFTENVTAGSHQSDLYLIVLVSFDPSGDMIATGNSDGSVSFYKTASSDNVVSSIPIGNEEFQSGIIECRPL